MRAPLHILHLEDDPRDAALIQFALESGGIAATTTCVEDEDAFVGTLEKGGVDLVLSDFALPAFDGLSALAIVQARWPEIPVILVSGTLGEELAIDSLKNGATDYVLKERLGRLAPAVRRALDDVGERASHRRMKGQFIEAQKMDIVGHLAAGVAHDFNNVLGVTMMCSDLLMAGLSQDSPLREYVEEIQNASERAVGLTRQLLIFSRKETVLPVVLDLNDVVEELDKMIGRLVDANIKMTIALGKNLGSIKADSGYIGQLLMNLVVNARDAMPAGGCLTISTAQVVLDDAYALAHPGVMPGRYVRLSVHDTGIGMDDEIKAHLFEAFFTTKPLGKGTGLGLATCQTIVQQSGGNICVESEVGRGTIFHIHFPRVEEVATVSVKTGDAGALPRGTETLLLVEDEPSVRYLARGVLAAYGYEVLTASNGQEALQVVRKHTTAPIGLVITDVVMPLMGGKVMAEWLRTSDPTLKILFTSGYSEEVVAHEGVSGIGIDFLAKPYTLATLIRRVREMLDR